MNLVDTNGISYIFNHDLTLREPCYLAPDVSEEVEMTQVIYSMKLPEEVSMFSGRPDFDEAAYLKYYKDMLNSHGGRSFFNMTGFGDISILACIHAQLHVYRKQREETLFASPERIHIFTDDGGLTKRILKEFESEDVLVSSVPEIS